MVVKSHYKAKNKFQTGKQLQNMPLKDMNNRELAEVYAYHVLTFGANHHKTNIVIDELNRRDNFAELVDQPSENAWRFPNTQNRQDEDDADYNTDYTTDVVYDYDDGSEPDYRQEI